MVYNNIIIYYNIIIKLYSLQFVITIWKYLNVTMSLCHIVTICRNGKVTDSTLPSYIRIRKTTTHVNYGKRHLIINQPNTNLYQTDLRYVPVCLGMRISLSHVRISLSHVRISLINDACQTDLQAHKIKKEAPITGASFSNMLLSFPLFILCFPRFFQFFILSLSKGYYYCFSTVTL